MAVAGVLKFEQYPASLHERLEQAQAAHDVPGLLLGLVLASVQRHAGEIGEILSWLHGGTYGEVR